MPTQNALKMLETQDYVDVSIGDDFLFTCNLQAVSGYFERT